MVVAETRNGTGRGDVGGGRRVTIGDVARTAGVSTSAVSKVLRGAYGVSPAMRHVVTAAIERLGYRPHTGARAMRGASFTVGVVLTELSSPFQSEVIQGISGEFDATPYQEVVIAAGTCAQRQKRSIEALVDRQIDGLILIAPWMKTAWLEQLARRIPTAVVALHGPATLWDSVVDDDFEGARMVVDHLVSQGHRHIVHTAAPPGGMDRPFLLSHTARQDGYEHAMRRHGLEPDVIVTSYTEDGGHQATLQALTRTQRPTAIFAGADIAALGALRAAEDLGLHVPAEVTIVGYDDTFVAGIGRIALTTVNQSGHLTGSVGARLLLERLNGRSSAVRYVVPPRLIERGTSAPPPEAPPATVTPRRGSGTAHLSNGNSKSGQQLRHP
jgi:LacI family transcriptional regulator